MDSRYDPQLRAFGERVKAIRKHRGLSQEGLSQKAELHRTVIGFIERADREVGLSKIWALADALDVQVGDLFSDEPPTSL